MIPQVEQFAKLDPRFLRFAQLRAMRMTGALMSTSEIEQYINEIACASNLDNAEIFEKLIIFAYPYAQQFIKEAKEYAFMPIIRAWQQSLENVRESFLPGMFGIAMAISSANPRPVTEIIVSEYNTLSPFTLTALDNYALDLHTTEGRTHGHRSRAQFAEIGAQVANEDPHWRIPILQEFYLISKRIQDGEIIAPFPILCPIAPVPGIPHSRESDILEFVVHAQLTTGMGKTDTYFARIRTDDDIRARCANGAARDECIAQQLKRARKLRAAVCPPDNSRALVFVKGPLPARVLQNAIHIAQIKRRVFPEIPSIRIVCMFCDEFDLFTSPIGQRVIQARPEHAAEPWGLLIAPNACATSAAVIAHDRAPLSTIDQLSSARCDASSTSAPAPLELPTIIRASNVYGPTQVVDWGPRQVSNDFIKSIDLTTEIDARHVRQITMAYLFRFILSIGDGALRNLLIAHNGGEIADIIAVDEDLIRDPPHATWPLFIDSLGSNAIKALLSMPLSEELRELIPIWTARLRLLRDNIVSSHSHVEINIENAIWRCSNLIPPPIVDNL